MLSFQVAVSPSTSTLHLIIVFCVSVCLSFLHSIIVPVRHMLGAVLHVSLFQKYSCVRYKQSNKQTNKNPLTSYPPYSGNIQVFCSAHCLSVQIYQHFVTEHLLQRLNSNTQNHQESLLV